MQPVPRRFKQGRRMKHALWMGCAAVLAAQGQLAAQDPNCTPGQGMAVGVAAHGADVELYDTPVGARQKAMFGKLWPPFARPVGKKQPFTHVYHDVHYWPYPYICPDRDSVNLYTDLQAANGWEQSTTLFDYHFDPATQQLNPAGQQHLIWILTTVPEAHRQVRIAVTPNSASTQVRTVNVESTIAQMAGGAAIPVIARVASPYGRPAAEVDRIFTQAREGMPSPVLQNAASGGGGSGGGGSGGGGGGSTN